MTEEADRKPGTAPALRRVEHQTDIEDWQQFCRLDRMSDHWWWRPGWQPGRRFLTWYVLFDDPAFASYVARFQRQLADLVYLDPVPADGVHMTVQGVAFVDEISDVQVAVIAEAARQRCATISAFTVDVGPVNAYSGGVLLRVGPWQPVVQVRQLLREAITAAHPAAVLPAVSRLFKPHISVAYCHAEVDAALVRHRLTKLRTTATTRTRVTGVSLLELRREDRVYRWDIRDAISFIS